MQGEMRITGDHENKKSYIFVSWAHDDEEVLGDIEYLRGQGFEIWYDKRDIPSASAWIHSIEKGIRDCSIFLIFLTETSANADWVLTEFFEAEKKRKGEPKRILPVFVQKDIDSIMDTRLKRLQGCERFGRELDDYRRDLCHKLLALDPKVRESSFDRDSKALGLGYLPELADTISGRVSLDEDEQESRRQKIVDDLHRQGSAVRSYEIDNVFQITSEITGAMGKLGKLERDNATRSQAPSNLLSLPLTIRQVYLAPLRLVTGLITRLAQNWPPLVASYSSLVKEDQADKLDDLHYYVEMCWLAWGPSVLTTELAFGNSKTDFMLAQAAYGDEAHLLILTGLHLRIGISRSGSRRTELPGVANPILRASMPWQ